MACHRARGHRSRAPPRGRAWRGRGKGAVGARSASGSYRHAGGPAERRHRAPVGARSASGSYRHTSLARLAILGTCRRAVGFRELPALGERLDRNLRPQVGARSASGSYRHVRLRQVIADFEVGARSASGSYRHGFKHSGSNGSMSRRAVGFRELPAQMTPEPAHSHAWRRRAVGFRELPAHDHPHRSALREAVGARSASGSYRAADVNPKRFHGLGLDAASGAGPNPRSATGPPRSPASCPASRRSPGASSASASRRLPARPPRWSSRWRPPSPAARHGA